jgi:sugar lactone lactonase YvrE
MSLMPGKYAAKSMVALAAAVAAVVPAVSATAAPAPVSAAHIVAHFDLAAGQQPENITLEPDGSADLSFTTAHEIARVSPQGKVRILAVLPAPADGGVNTPLVGSARTFGIVRASSGTLYVLYNTGTADLTGVWRLRPGSHTPTRIAALPADGLANGMALDEHTGMLYIADSVHGVVWQVPDSGGTPKAFASGGKLTSTAGSFGANGVKVHNGAVWVSNSQQGLLLRIPIEHCGTAGPMRTMANVAGIDDFTFTGQGDTVLAAINGASQIALVRSDGTQSIVLTMANGLQNPTSMSVRGHTLYVASAAYSTQTDPNLLLAHLAN